MVPPDGNLIVAVFGSKKTFLSDKPKDVIASKKVVLKGKLKDGKITTSLSLPAGEYAFSIFQLQWISWYTIFDVFDKSTY